MDKTVLSIVNKNSVSLEDFEFKENSIIIKDNARRLIISKILDKLGSKIQFNDSNMSYFDITGQGLDIDYDFMEAIIAKQPKPNLYIMVDMVYSFVYLFYSYIVYELMNFQAVLQGILTSSVCLP